MILQKKDKVNTQTWMTTRIQVTPTRIQVKLVNNWARALQIVIIPLVNDNTTANNNIAAYDPICLTALLRWQSE